MTISIIEKLGFVILFRSPDELYVKFVTANEPIKLKNITTADEIPHKNDILLKSKFLVKHNGEYLLCEISEDFKYDEIFCQVALCNSNSKLKIDYKSLIPLVDSDIINDDSCFSVKFNDFSPIYPNNWNCDLISKLKDDLSFNKFIFQFKSYKADPIDGRYPVEVLRLSDRSSINEECINNKLASHNLDYFREALENETMRIFYYRKEKDVRYKISNPLVKIQPVLRSKISPNKSLNVQAEPFVPATKELPVTSESTKSTGINTHIKVTSNESSCTVPTPVVSNSVHLQSNIVNMFSEMYKMRSKTNATLPFNNYKSVFPNYGGVNFAQNSSNVSNKSTSRESSLNIQNLKTNHSTSTSNSFASNQMQPDLQDKSNSCNQPIVSGDETPVVEVSSIPLPSSSASIDPNTIDRKHSPDSNSAVESTQTTDSLSEVINEQDLQVERNEIIDQSCQLQNTPQENTMLSNSDFQRIANLMASSLNKLSIASSTFQNVPPPQFINNSCSMVPSLPLLPTNKAFRKNLQLKNENKPPFFMGNFSNAPFMPPFIELPRVNYQYPGHFFPNAAPPIRFENLSGFHPSFQPYSLVKNNDVIPPITEDHKEKTETENNQSFVNSDTGYQMQPPAGMWVQAPPNFMGQPQQMGQIQIQPINLIYYKPN